MSLCAQTGTGRKPGLCPSSFPLRKRSGLSPFLESSVVGTAASWAYSSGTSPSLLCFPVKYSDISRYQEELPCRSEYTIFNHRVYLHVHGFPAFGRLSTSGSWVGIVIQPLSQSQVKSALVIPNCSASFSVLATKNLRVSRVRSGAFSFRVWLMENNRNIVLLCVPNEPLLLWSHCLPFANAYHAHRS